MSTIVTASEEEFISQLSKLIVYAYRESNKEFKIGVSGGSVVKFFAKALLTIDVDFSKWKIFFCDERIVPEEDAESTFGTYKKELIGKIDHLTEAQFVKIKQGVTAEEAAEDYIKQMEQYFPSESLPKFDILLLGVGPDGHTCSLFPMHPLLKEDKVWVAPITNSPKPPLCRVTMTYPVLNNAKMIVFALGGEGKADIVKRIVVDKEELPAGLVKPTHGQLIWILDKQAGKYI